MHDSAGRKGEGEVGGKDEGLNDGKEGEDDEDEVKDEEGEVKINGVTRHCPIRYSISVINDLIFTQSMRVSGMFVFIYRVCVNVFMCA